MGGEPERETEVHVHVIESKFKVLIDIAQQRARYKYSNAKPTYNAQNHTIRLALCQGPMRMRRHVFAVVGLLRPRSSPRACAHGTERNSDKHMLTQSYVTSE